MNEIPVPINEPLTDSNDAIEVIILINCDNEKLWYEMGGVYYTFERMKLYVENWLEAAWLDNNQDKNPGDPHTQYVPYFNEYVRGEWRCDIYVDNALHYTCFKTYLRR